MPDPTTDGMQDGIVPDRTTDETKLADALGKLVHDDPTLRCRTDCWSRS